MRNILIFLITSLLSTSIMAQNRIVGKSHTSRSEVLAQNGMVATCQPLATNAALDILKKGGNAFDAAIAANAMLGLVEPHNCGIGGDLFAIVWDAKKQKLYGLNASGRSPKTITADYFRQKGMDYIPSTGALSVSVPGCVDGWDMLHKRFGKLSMVEILQPSIDYGTKGFPVTEVIAAEMQASAGNRTKLPGFKETYMPNGHIPAKGEIFKNTNLAKVYELIAKGGRDAFYKGEIAKTIGAYIKENGGFLSHEDLAAHTSNWVEPVSTNYRGYDVWELPPNGQGIAALQMLNILEEYDIASMGFGSAEYLHVLTEAKKLAFEDRAKYYADMDFNKIPVDELISKSYADKRRKLLDREHAALDYPAGELEQGNTTYLTVADKEGNMVSLIQSNYAGFGSGMCPTGLGFALQNRGQMFNVQDPKHVNYLQPGKRPFHTIIPAFITKDNKPYVSFGLMGGAMQPQGHAQIVINIIDFGMNLQEAGDAPRMRHMGSSQPMGEKMTDGGILNLENGFEYDVIRDLVTKGHQVQFAVGAYGGYQAIKWDEKNKVYYGATESRKDGQAAGY
ncbi:MAG: gamma-glutamyltransferase [Saprospiraceae bacterium]|nr:gamma-glutamyltransferase [Saprospiraceae bacterium]